MQDNIHSFEFWQAVREERSQALKEQRRYICNSSPTFKAQWYNENTTIQEEIVAIAKKWLDKQRRFPRSVEIGYSVLFSTWEKERTKVRTAFVKAMCRKYAKNKVCV
jgi:hypothetical protein